MKISLNESFIRKASFFLLKSQNKINWKSYWNIISDHHWAIKYSISDSDNSIIIHLQCIRLILLFLTAYLADLVSSQRKVSPCPSVFVYDSESDTSDTWYGTLSLQTTVPLHGITVDVIFDRRVTSFGAFYFNDVITSDYKEYRIENKNFKLDPGRTLVMNIHVKYSDYPPLLKQVRLNGQNVCVDLPIVGVQPIYNYQSNSNAQLSTSTKRTTRRENPNFRLVKFA